MPARVPQLPQLQAAFAGSDLDATSAPAENVSQQDSTPSLESAVSEPRQISTHLLLLSEASQDYLEFLLEVRIPHKIPKQYRSLLIEQLINYFLQLNDGRPLNCGDIARYMNTHSNLKALIASTLNQLEYLLSDYDELLWTNALITESQFPLMVPARGTRDTVTFFDAEFVFAALDLHPTELRNTNDNLLQILLGIDLPLGVDSHALRAQIESVIRREACVSSDKPITVAEAARFLSQFVQLRDAVVALLAKTDQ